MFCHSQVVLKQPDPVEGSCLQDPSVQFPMVEGPVHVSYEIVADGTKRRWEKLGDSLRYVYNVKERGKVTTYWQCTVWLKWNPCKATVKQTNGEFLPGMNGHSHPANVGALLATKISTSVKRKAVDQLFKPASAIVEEVLHLSIMFESDRNNNILGTNFDFHCVSNLLSKIT